MPASLARRLPYGSRINSILVADLHTLDREFCRNDHSKDLR